MAARSRISDAGTSRKLVTMSGSGSGQPEIRLVLESGVREGAVWFFEIVTCVWVCIRWDWSRIAER